MTTTIYLIRHAQCLQSPKQHFSQWPLSTTGIQQAENLADLLKPLQIEGLYSSPFNRCLETVAPFTATTGLDVAVRQDLREQLIANEFMDGFLEVWRKCWADFTYAYPGCESCNDAQRRFVSETRNILEENEKRVIGICTHGMVISLFLNYIDAAFSRTHAEQLKNPDIFRVEYIKNQFIWDREFCLPGMDDISSRHNETPIDLTSVYSSRSIKKC